MHKTKFLARIPWWPRFCYYPNFQKSNWVSKLMLISYIILFYCSVSLNCSCGCLFLDLCCIYDCFGITLQEVITLNKTSILCGKSESALHYLLNEWSYSTLPGTVLHNFFKLKPKSHLSVLVGGNYFLQICNPILLFCWNKW